MLSFRIDSALLVTKELDDSIDILVGNRLLFEDSCHRPHPISLTLTGSLVEGGACP
jgi:hypothetical protein